MSYSDYCSVGTLVWVWKVQKRTVYRRQIVLSHTATLEKLGCDNKMFQRNSLCQSIILPPPACTSWDWHQWLLQHNVKDKTIKHLSKSRGRLVGAYWGLCECPRKPRNDFGIPQKLRVSTRRKHGCFMGFIQTPQIKAFDRWLTWNVGYDMRRARRYAMGNEELSKTQPTPSHISFEGEKYIPLASHVPFASRLPTKTLQANLKQI